MNTNAMNLMILPVVLGLGLGAALGVAVLLVVRAIDSLSGRGHGPTEAPPRAGGPPAAAAAGGRRRRPRPDPRGIRWPRAARLMGVQD